MEGMSGMLLTVGQMLVRLYDHKREDLINDELVDRT
jgi:hypothetical protein